MQLSVIRKNLPFRYGHIIKQQTGYSLSMIMKVINGERTNDEIIEAAIALAEEQIAKAKKRDSKIKKLCK